MSDLITVVDKRTNTNRSWLSSRITWALLFAVVVGVLAFGSVHNSSTSAAARVSYLESVIKCPPCADVSIAQSDDQQAVALRHSVVAWVNAGWSDSRIETTVVDEYGTDEILEPRSTGIDSLVWILPLVVVIGGTIGIAGSLFRRRGPSSSLSSHRDDEALVAAARRQRPT